MQRLILFFFTLNLFACSAMVTPIAGNFAEDPMKKKAELSPKAQELIENAFNGPNPRCLLDVHVHLVGVGSGHTGAWVNPHMNSLLSPYKKLQYNVYMSASGIKSYETADHDYLERLMILLRAEPRLGRVLLFGFDYHYDENGERNLEKSSFYIPNDYVEKVANEHPDLFVPVISVHPDRPDAIAELTKWAKKGVKFIKWLPNAQRIDASLEKHRAYYDIMLRYGMTLIGHTGEERAVEGEENQRLGNPLLFKFPLDMGVKVIMAHAASLGQCEDFETEGKPHVACFDLFWRMFTSPKYKKNLFTELSGMTLHTRIGKPILTLLEHPEYADRIMNGSDYPLPAINILYRTGQLQDLGYLTEEERTALNEVYEYNPLAFDFVMKRTMRHPVTKRPFPAKTFEAPFMPGCR
jgi:predicted TIM-barrel fold metal-dependent hydrolase